MTVFYFDESTFDAEVLDSDVPVLVDFYTEWCGPCKMIAPILERLAAEYEGRLVVGKINAESETMLAQEYEIVSVPTMILFVKGEPVERIVGFHSQANLETLLQKYL